MIYYAHTGGYTELGGIKTFLEKINNNLEYQRLVPAVAKLPKKRKIKDIDSGITGKSLFDRIKERAKLNKDIKILIIIDDGDCKIKNGILNNSIKDLEKELSNINLIFLFAEPEIEKWFCLDKSWIQNSPCNGQNIHSLLNILVENYDYRYDKNKKSCKTKFSDKFKHLLDSCGIFYSKDSSGSEYLQQIDPQVIYKKDEFVKEAIDKIKSLKTDRNFL